jgi:hypothetical protein
LTASRIGQTTIRLARANKGEAMKGILFLFATCVVASALLVPANPTLLWAAQEKPSDEAIKRTRKTVEMLDHIYKSAIVLITDRYVNTKKDYPAGRAAVKWFEDISKKGSHEVRIIDATGSPYSPKNVAQDDFEEEGIKQLKAGKPYYEKVITKDGKSYLRAITPVPVVMEKCIMCHAHYEDAKKGEPVGALTYTVPIE